MLMGFDELNLFVYNSARNVVLDGVIWCLGPMVDDSREYGWFRICLAAATRQVCRRLLRVED